MQEKQSTRLDIGKVEAAVVFISSLATLVKIKLFLSFVSPCTSFLSWLSESNNIVWHLKPHYVDEALKRHANKYHTFWCIFILMLYSWCCILEWNEPTMSEAPKDWNDVLITCRMVKLVCSPVSIILMSLNYNSALLFFVCVVPLGFIAVICAGLILLVLCAAIVTALLCRRGHVNHQYKRLDIID